MAPLCPPPGVPAGEVVTFEGHAQSPVDAGNRAGKAWKKVSKTLVVKDDNVRIIIWRSMIYFLYAIFLRRDSPCAVSLCNIAGAVRRLFLQFM